MDVLDAGVGTKAAGWWKAMGSVAGQEHPPKLKALGDLSRSRPKRDIDQFHRQVGDTYGCPRELKASLRREVFWPLARGGLEGTQDQPAIGTVRPKQSAVSNRGDVANRGAILNPGSQFGAKVDVDVVVEFSRTEHGDAERIANAARGPIRSNDVGRPRHFKLSRPAIPQGRGNAASILIDRRELGIKAQTNFRVGLGVSTQGRLERGLGNRK